MTRIERLQLLADAELARHFEPGVLARGRLLARAVAGLSQREEGAVLAATAEVPGSRHPYRVQLSLAPGSRLRGHCECVYAEGGLPCKHQAALALAWRARVSGEALRAAPLPAAAAPTAASGRRRKAGATPAPAPAQANGPSAELLQKLLALADGDPALRAELLRLQTAPAQAEAGTDSLAEAKKQISTLLAAPRELFEWRRVGAYVRKAEGVLTLLQGWTAEQPQLALAGAEWALTKLRRVWQQADDSDGAIGALMAALAQQWLLSLQAAGPQSADFAERYAKLVAADEHGHFDHAAALQAMGTAAAQRYGEIVHKAWQANQAGARERLLQHWQASGDAQAELALRRATLADASDHIALIDALRRLNHPREALAAAEAAHRAHPEHPALTERLLQAYEQDGWDAEALALHLRLFTQQPSLARYELALAAAQRLGAEQSAQVRAQLWRWLDEEATSFIGLLPLADLRLQLLAHEGRWGEALAWLQAHPRAQAQLGAAGLRRFALSLPAGHEVAAVELLKAALALAMPRAVSPYAQELRLVRDTLDRLPPPQAQLWLAWLKLEFRAKRGFVDGLIGL